MIRWTEVYQRLAAAERSIARADSPSPDRVQQVLKARSLALARSVNAARRPTDTVEVLVFDLAGEPHAIESPYVCEVMSLRNVTPVPCTPAYVVGILNWRGQILSVLDLQKLLHLAQEDLHSVPKLIVLESEAMMVGIAADEIIGFRQLGTSELQGSLSALTANSAGYIKGLAADQTIVLDADALLSAPAIIINETVNT